MKFRQKQSLQFIIFAFIGLTVSSGLLAQKNDDLLEKVWLNDIQAVKKLIASGADINYQNEMYGHTPLIIARNYNYVEMAKLLISEGADIKIKGKDGSTALIAAASNSQELVEILLSKGADVKARMTNGTGVFTRCTIGILKDKVPLQLAEILLSKGADVDESATTGAIAGYTPLMTAARNNHVNLVNFLIKNGADVNAKSGDGSTPLSLATKEGHRKIINILKAGGAK